MDPCARGGLTIQFCYTPEYQSYLEAVRRAVAIIFFNDSKKWKCVFFFVNPVLDFERGVLRALKVFLQTIGSFSNVSFCIFSFCDNYGLIQSVIQIFDGLYYNTVNVVQYNVMKLILTLIVLDIGDDTGKQYNANGNIEYCRTIRPLSCITDCEKTIINTKKYKYKSRPIRNFQPFAKRPSEL